MDSIELNLKANIRVKVDNCKFVNITAEFLKALSSVFTQYVTQLLTVYFEQIRSSGELERMLNAQKVTLKSMNRTTKFNTIFGCIHVPQIQVRVYRAGSPVQQVSITRMLLGVGYKCQIPDFMKELMGWIGSLCTYRVGHSILGALTNFKCSLFSAWASVQYAAQRIDLKLSDNGTNEFEADGTGIPTLDSGKRGSELKKVFQRKLDGTLHLIGLSIGKYKDFQTWTSALCAGIHDGIEQFGKIILASDGDKTISDAAALDRNVKFQKDKWHVFHQLKYYLWKDGADKDLKNNIIGHFYKITMLLKCSAIKRDRRISNYIQLLGCSGFRHTATYLATIMDGFYTHETENNTNVFTTKTERSMRTTNQRVNVGVWTDSGAYNAVKIRLAYYYNGISPVNWKN